MLRPLARSGEAPASVPNALLDRYQRVGFGATMRTPSSSISGRATSSSVAASSSLSASDAGSINTRWSCAMRTCTGCTQAQVALPGSPPSARSM